ncbi:MAG: putative rane protein [Actinomycetia bacterium]|nr:putative rane protein [Actinomycetes bacterium]
MNAGAWIALAAAAAVAVVDWVAVARRAKRWERIAKPLVPVLLIAVALTIDPARADARPWFVAALVASLVGDVLLLLPHAFVPGLGAFLLAHVAYIVGLNVDGGGGVAALSTGAVVLGAAVVLVGRRLLAGMAARGGSRERLPVIVYMTVIAAMGASAVATGRVLPAAGALLFMASDALIGWRRYVHEEGWMNVVVMVTYHVGQAMLVLSLAA